MTIVRVAACHASPIFLNAPKTATKAVHLIQEAASHGAQIITFPETFIPGFPFWSALRAPAENHSLFKSLVHASPSLSSAPMRAIQDAAAQHSVTVSMGFSERPEDSIATLYNSNVIYGPDGGVLVHHRKLVATFFEKLSWAPGDGEGLRVAHTPNGRVGQLICGDNTNTLARYALMAQGEQIHISSWPAAWPTRLLPDVGDGGKAPAGEESGAEKNYDNVSANRLRVAAHCFEAKCFGVMCAAALDDVAIATTAAGARDPDIVRSTLRRSPRGATMYINPSGGVLPGFTVDSATGKKKVMEFLQQEEGILYADMDLDDCIEGKQFHDVAGGYQRPDVFDLRVRRERRSGATFLDTAIPASEWSDDPV
ncbi:carbon-nitrogen hydrolase [Myriangium duriaei CBS 260.36]|uniref:Carbon-nitrogen hydrolase n=1 Tax=Myriangium duriaei CBS 260.36 TaxID=1168546 RepID=A0A9P4ITU1_9PEZI|nr:carbon-nitrogen hydrolase [Myriangium duriaei CBS 260.36]